MGIDDRLAFMLGDRTAKHFSQRYGLNKNWAQFLKSEKGTYKLIWPLILSENISADWLLSGHGQPYRVNHWFDAGPMYEAVKEMLKGKGWSVFLLGGDGLIIWRYIGLTVEEDEKGGGMNVEYQAHFGPINEQLISLIADSKAFIQCADLPEDVLLKIKNGEIGTYKLFSYPLEVYDGFLGEDKDWPSVPQEEMRDYYEEFQDIGSTIGIDELAIIRNFRDLPETRKQVVRDILASYQAGEDD